MNVRREYGMDVLYRDTKSSRLVVYFHGGLGWTTKDTQETCEELTQSLSFRRYNVLAIVRKENSCDDQSAREHIAIIQKFKQNMHRPSSDVIFLGQSFGSWVIARLLHFSPKLCTSVILHEPVPWYDLSVWLTINGRLEWTDVYPIAYSVLQSVAPSKIIEQIDLPVSDLSHVAMQLILYEQDHIAPVKFTLHHVLFRRQNLSNVATSTLVVPGGHLIGDINIVKDIDKSRWWTFKQKKFYPVRESQHTARRSIFGINQYPTIGYANLTIPTYYAPISVEFDALWCTRVLCKPWKTFCGLVLPTPDMSSDDGNTTTIHTFQQDVHGDGIVQFRIRATQSESGLSRRTTVSFGLAVRSKKSQRISKHSLWTSSVQPSQETSSVQQWTHLNVEAGDEIVLKIFQSNRRTGKNVPNVPRRWKLDGEITIMSTHAQWTREKLLL